MFKYIIFSVIFFLLGLFTREIIEFLENKKRYNNIKLLSEQDLKNVMNDLEIK